MHPSDGPSAISNLTRRRQFRLCLACLHDSDDRVHDLCFVARQTIAIAAQGSTIPPIRAKILLGVGWVPRPPIPLSSAKSYRGCSGAKSNPRPAGAPSARTNSLQPEKILSSLRGSTTTSPPLPDKNVARNENLLRIGPYDRRGGSQAVCGLTCLRVANRCILDVSGRSSAIPSPSRLLDDTPHGHAFRHI